MLAGTHLICHAENRPTKEDRPFTVCTWEKVDDERWEKLLEAVEAQEKDPAKAQVEVKAQEKDPAQTVAAQTPPAQANEAPEVKARKGIGLPRRNANPF